MFTHERDLTTQDWLNIAAIYGDEAAFLMSLIKSAGDNDAAAQRRGDRDAYARGYRAGCQGEAERIAVDLARRAAHAYFMAEHEADKQATFLLARAARAKVLES